MDCVSNQMQIVLPYRSLLTLHGEYWLHEQHDSGNLLNSMSPEDIAKMGEGLVFLTTLLQRLADPGLQAKIVKLVDMLGEIDMAKVKPTGLLGMVGALCSAEGKQTLGLLVELINKTGSCAK